MRADDPREIETTRIVRLAVLYALLLAAVLLALTGCRGGRTVEQEPLPYVEPDPPTQTQPAQRERTSLEADALQLAASITAAIEEPDDETRRALLLDALEAANVLADTARSLSETLAAARFYLTPGNRSTTATE